MPSPGPASALRPASPKPRPPGPRRIPFPDIAQLPPTPPSSLSNATPATRTRQGPRRALRGLTTQPSASERQPTRQRLDPRTPPAAAREEAACSPLLSGADHVQLIAKLTDTGGERGSRLPSRQSLGHLTSVLESRSVKKASLVQLASLGRTELLSSSSGPALCFCLC